MDVYIYAFGSTANPVILRHVSYGNVSDYMPVKAGQYTAFGSATGYQPLAPGSETVKFTSSGGPDTGFGSTAPQPADSLPWLLTVAGGALLALAGWASLRRTRGARSGTAQ